MSIDHYQNVISLLEQYVRLQNKRTRIEQQLQCQPTSLDNIDHIEKLEEELNFVISYSRTIMDQATVIMHENNVQNVPSIEVLLSKLLA